MICIAQWGRTGGGPLVAWHLAAALEAEGTPVSVSYAAGADIAPRFAALPVPAFPVRTFRTAAGALLRLPSLLVQTLRLRRFLARTGATHVVIAMEQLWLSLATPLLRSRRWRVVTAVHDARMHPGDANRIEAVTRTWGRRWSDAALVFSSAVRDLLVADRGFRPECIWQTVHGAFSDAPAPAAPRSAPVTRPLVIGMFGRISEYKGIGLGHAAVARLRERGHRIRFHVVGDGDRRLVAGVAHTDDRVDFCWTPDDEVAQVIASFDILLLPYTEASQSGVLAYAMGLGVPAVVTPVGGLEEQARAAGCAVVAGAVTPEALADAILDASEPARYQRLSSAGRDAAAAAFSWRRVAADLTAASIGASVPESRAPAVSPR